MRSQTPTRRILCLWFPDWPIQHLVSTNPELEKSVLLLTERTQRGEFVRHCNMQARKRRIRAGMPVAEARSFVLPRDEVVVRTIHSENDRKELAELALRCQAYSPCIGLDESDHPENLLMDVTGVAHLFQGEHALAEHLERTLFEQDLDGRIALTGSVGSAWAAAHFLAAPRQPVIIQTSQQSLLESLPIQALRLSDSSVTKLHKLGVKTIGQIVALDRASLVARFGTEITLRLDQLTGQREELITPLVSAPKFRAERFLEDGLTRPESIEQLWSVLLRRILAMLQKQRLGTRLVRCEFCMENRTSHEVIVRLCHTTADERHIGDLLSLQLERIHWSAPVIGLTIEALEVAPLLSSQAEFFSKGTREQVHQVSILLNRLSNRLGEEAVGRPQLLPDPVPERSVRFIPVTRPEPPSSSVQHDWLSPLDRPPALFAQPRLVEVIAVVPDGPPVVLFWRGARFDISLHWGPERIEFGWWSGYVRRDYYRIETTEGRWLWLFKRLQDGSWFWHGEAL